MLLLACIKTNLPRDTIRFVFPESSARKLRVWAMREDRSRGEGGVREEARKLIEIRVSGRNINSSGEKSFYPIQNQPTLAGASSEGFLAPTNPSVKGMKRFYRQGLMQSFLLSDST